MTAVLVEVELTHRSGLVKDTCINTFAFSTPGTDPVADEVLDIWSALENFYNVAPAGHNAIANVISGTISRTANACHMKAYDLTGHLNGSAHGSPFALHAWTLAATAGTPANLPSEVAVALSFHTAYGADAEFAGPTRPRARDRGRVFIGPLTVSALSEDPATGAARPVVTFRETLIDRAEVLRDSSLFAWAVWSRKNSTVDPVTDMWCDDAFDTIRRRGEKSISRLTADPPS